MILLSAFIGAIVVGVLTYAVRHSAAQSVLAGLGAFGAAVTFFDRIIGTRWE